MLFSELWIILEVQRAKAKFSDNAGHFGTLQRFSTGLICLKYNET